MSVLSDADRALAEAACLRLAKEFALTSDLLEFDAYSQLFADDAIFERPGLRCEGREAIVAALRDRPPERKMRHLLSNAVVDIRADDTATGRGNYIVYLQGEAGQPPASGCVDYHDDYRRIDGRWFFVERSVAISF